MNDDFVRNIISGLQKEEKRIASKYLYDEKGSLLFQEIMDQPEYYLTKAEWSIFKAKASAIVELLVSRQSNGLQLMELGAGDGRKTALLLNALDQLGVPTQYEPVDIDKAVLNQLTDRLKSKYRDIQILPRAGYNEDALTKVAKDKKTVILFLGSNIGNYSKPEETALMQRIAGAMKKGDSLLLGADRAKDPKLISRAYNDRNGKTAEFNLNLIRRINQSWDAHLDIDAFQFYAYYHPRKREVHAFLVTNRDQRLALPNKSGSIHLPAWTYIQTEISRKYRLMDLEEMGKNVGLKLDTSWVDPNHYFFELLYTKK